MPARRVRARVLISPLIGAPTREDFALRASERSQDAAAPLTAELLQWHQENNQAACAKRKTPHGGLAERRHLGAAVRGFKADSISRTGGARSGRPARQATGRWSTAAGGSA